MSFPLGRGRALLSHSLRKATSAVVRSVREQVAAAYTAYAAALDEEDRAFAAATRARRGERARSRVEAGRE